MKKIVAAVLSLAVVVSSLCYSARTDKEIKAADGWNLVWSDEFEGTSLDTNTWTYETGNGNWGWGNGEIQYYTKRKDNVNVTDGNLQIIAKRENYNGYKYTSGRLISKNKKHFKYGYMEAKIKVENGNQSGVWPAFWMMGNNIDQVGWPRCGEIDIMEHANSNNFIGGCLHWGENNTSNHKYYSSGDNGDQYDDYYFSDNVNNGINGWHTYGILWTEDYIEWYVDGNAYFKQKLTSNKAYCVQQTHFFLLNLAIGGTGTAFTGYQTADENTYKTTTMYVDYVRVYKNDAVTEPETTTKYDGPTITVTEDAVEKTTANWDSFFGQADWCGGANGSITNENSASEGVTVNVTTTGTDRWGIQTFLKGLNYYPGNTYTYKCTLTSDTDKVVFVKVAGDGDQEISGEYISLKSNEPYNYTKEVIIPEDYDGVLDLYFGLGRCDGDTIDSASGYTLDIKDVSFTATAKIPDPNYVPPTTTKAPSVDEPETTTKVPSVVETTSTENITVAPTTTTKQIKVGKTKVKKATKKKAAKKIKITLKRIKGAKKYQVQISKKKKFNKKNILVRKTVKKVKFTIKRKKFKNKKRLWVRARAIKVVDGKKYIGKWSKKKKVRIRK